MNNRKKTKQSCLRAALLLLGTMAFAGPVQAQKAENRSDAGWVLEAIHGEETMELDGHGIRIAILDTGVRRSHEIFEGSSIEDGYDYTGKGENGTKDFIGHGTFLASLLCAAPGNSWGIHGLAPGAQIIPLKCFDKEKAVVSRLAKAIYDAADIYECDIIHMSWGLTEPDEELKKAVEYAAEKGIVMVASCGNEGGNDRFYPAAWPEVISVGAVDKEMKPAQYSQKNPEVWVVAPGSGLCGAGHTSDKAEACRSGTSYAAAYVTGAAALALQINPDVTPDKLAQVLAETAQDLGEEGYDTETGYGLLDIENFLSRIIF